MKLLNYTSRYLLWLIIFLLTILGVLLFVSIKYTISNDIDEYLTSTKLDLISTIEKHPEILTEKSAYHKNFEVEEIAADKYKHFLEKHRKGKFKDFENYDQYEQEDEPFRRIEFVLAHSGKYYKITFVASLINQDELLWTILADIILFSLILVTLVVALNRLLLKKIWHPFYINMQRMRDYQLDKHKTITFEPSNIQEFQELNHSVKELIEKNSEVYSSQKQFIENASHEMQTPLGVIQNKIYNLIEDPALTSTQAGIIDDITEHVERLSRLNKTLLLLSKIENKQFAEQALIHIPLLIAACCEDFTELIEFKQLELKIKAESDITIEMHPDLARILFSNLIKNAINHNVEAGFIEVTVNAKQVIIANSGKELLVSPEMLFERFQKKSTVSQSTGLGLAIVKTICDAYDFTVQYQYAEKKHTITLHF